jgi:hypothetical protein
VNSQQFLNDGREVIPPAMAPEAIGSAAYDRNPSREFESDVGTVVEDREKCTMDRDLQMPWRVRLAQRCDQAGEPGQRMAGGSSYVDLRVDASHSRFSGTDDGTISTSICFTGERY